MVVCGLSGGLRCGLRWSVVFRHTVIRVSARTTLTAAIKVRLASHELLCTLNSWHISIYKHGESNMGISESVAAAAHSESVYSVVVANIMC